jgi:hypothetical protein
MSYAIIGFGKVGFGKIVMGEAIEQRRRHLGIAEDGGPFAETEVDGDDDAGALVERAQQMERQRPA